jgi:hypothetical protein
MGESPNIPHLSQTRLPSTSASAETGPDRQIYQRVGLPQDYRKFLSEGSVHQFILQGRPDFSKTDQFPARSHGRASLRR